MSRSISRRLLAQSPLILPSESLFRKPLRCLRPFWNSPRRSATKDDSQAPPTAQSTLSSPPTNPRSSPTPQDDSSTSSPHSLSSPLPPRSPSLNPKASTKSNSMADLANLMAINQTSRANKPPSIYDTPDPLSDGGLTSDFKQRYEEPHHFHIFATRHNTHITITDPNRNALISMSCGSIGFRKSGRKHDDSAFQLAGFVLSQMNERGIPPQIKRLEVVLRGFGAGREAVTKAILGLEGRWLRSKVVKVTDATRLKFGGTRSPKPSRLG